MVYKVVLEKTEEGYSVSVPGLPGCWSQGVTEAEAVENVRVAIEEYLAARDELVRGADVREVDVRVPAWRRSPASIPPRPSGRSNGRGSGSSARGVTS